MLLQLATRWPQLSVALMVGGTDVNADITAWREKGGHVLVGTPGRLDDLMVRLGSEMMLRELELLVLDEADRSARPAPAAPSAPSAPSAPPALLHPLHLPPRRLPGRRVAGCSTWTWPLPQPSYIC